MRTIGQLDESNPNSDNYQVSTQVYARAEEEELDGVAGETYSGSCNLIAGALVCPPTTPGGTSSRTYSVTRLSDSFACKPDGTKWKVKVTAYYLDANDGNTEKYFDLVGGSGTSENVDLGTTSLSFTTEQNPLFRVTPDVAASPGCNGSDVFSTALQNQSTTDSNTPQFKLLQDADIIPDELQNEAYIVTDSNNAQNTALEVLTNGGLIDSIQTNKVNTGNDYLVAFEIGQTERYLPDDDDPNTPREQNPGYDFQDQIFKINVQ